MGIVYINKILLYEFWVSGKWFPIKLKFYCTIQVSSLNIVTSNQILESKETDIFYKK